MVVKPDIDSKKEFTKDKFGVPKKKGTEPITVRRTHEIKVKIKADRISTSLILFLKINEILKPENKHKTDITKKTIQSVPSIIKSYIAGINR